MPTTGQSFTEQDVESFFDQTHQTYLDFWDSEGVLHTGYFNGEYDHDYHAAAERTSDVVATEAGINASSYVLDVGCGCGPFLLYLARRFGCRGEGLDLSIERINSAVGCAWSGDVAEDTSGPAPAAVVLRGNRGRAGPLYGSPCLGWNAPLTSVNTIRMMAEIVSSKRGKSAIL